MGGQVSGVGLQLGSGEEGTDEGREGSRTHAYTLTEGQSTALWPEALEIGSVAYSNIL